MLAGLPIKVPDCNFAVTQPTIKDIIAFGEDKFLNALQLFINTDFFVKPIKEGNSQLSMLSDFHIFMIILNEDMTTRHIIEDLFSLIFPTYIIKIEQGIINFQLDEESGIIGQLNPMNFDAFGVLLDSLFLPRTSSKDEPDFNPVNDKAAEIAEKLKKGRRDRAALANDGKKASSMTSIFSNYISVLSVGLPIDINILYGYTPYQLYNIFIRYIAKTAYDFYQKVATTPLMDVSKMDEPDNWMDDKIYQL